MHLSRRRRTASGTSATCACALLLVASTAALAATGPAGAAADRLARAEANFGPDSAEVLAPVIELAAVTLAAGDAEGADALLRRATALLDRHPDPDGTLRIRVLILQSDRLVRVGRLADSNQALYEARKLARSSEAIGPLTEANILDRLAANEARRGRVTMGNSYTSDALKLREKHYGKDSPEFAAALLKSADWYRYTGEPGREIEQEEKALAVLEKHFGPRDSRLAIVLIRLATARIAQHRHRNDAERAMQRAMALDFGPGSADAYIRGEVLATSADVQVVFGKPEDSSPLYTEAWQAIAKHERLGATAANQYFGKVRRLFLATPDNIANIGTVDLAYTVTPIGTVDAVRILDNAVPAIDGADMTVKSEVGADMWRAMRRSRFRPRIVDGAPVATPDLSFAAEFCLDPEEIVPICTARAEASVAR
jgi:hypothetical protein